MLSNFYTNFNGTYNIYYSRIIDNNGYKMFSPPRDLQGHQGQTKLGQKKLRNIKPSHMKNFIK